MQDNATEINDWAHIVHVEDPKPPGGTFTAYDRVSGALVGALSYFWLNPERTRIQFKDVSVEQDYRRRRVATALLRHLNHCHPDALINPGTRSYAGEGFMKHILSTEAAKVATNGILNVPLSTMLPPGFRPADVRARMGAS